MRTQLSLVPGNEIRVTSNQWAELPTFEVHNQTNINPFLTIINPLAQNESTLNPKQLLTNYNNHHTINNHHQHQNH